jgi:hypothetical protein
MNEIAVSVYAMPEPRAPWKKVLCTAPRMSLRDTVQCGWDELRWRREKAIVVMMMTGRDGPMDMDMDRYGYGHGYGCGNEMGRGLLGFGVSFGNRELE